MLTEGSLAPAFELQSDDGKTVSLAELAGKHVVLFFYPKDSTPGCTREAQAFSAAAKKLAKVGAKAFGISKDSIKSHCSFRDKYALEVPLLSDPDQRVHKAYGAFGEKTLYGKKVLGTIRSTFIVDPKGKIAKIFAPVKVDGHVDAVIEALAALPRP